MVHISAGAAALAAVLFIGRRTGYPRRSSIPHNVPLVLLGAGILWFGWFGFNAGSALGANALAASAFVTTHLGAAGALIGWLTAAPEAPQVVYLVHGEPDARQALADRISTELGWLAVAPQHLERVRLC